MNKKKILFYFGLVAAVGIAVGFLPVTPQVHAANLLQKEERLATVASNEANRQSQTLARIIQKADLMIADRLASLNRLLTRISQDKHLSSADKTSLTNDINTTISQLQALKTKIDADTDAATALADAKSIVTTFRIYVIYEPKIRLLITINNLQTMSTTLSGLNTQIQTLLNKLKSQGKDTTEAQNTLNDAIAQLASITSILATDKTLVQNVTVATNNPQSVFVQVRKDLATVRADFAKIRADYAALRETIKINVPKGTVTLKPSPASESAK